MDFSQISCTRLSEFLNFEFCSFSSNFDTVLVFLTTILCWSVAIRYFNTFSLKVIHMFASSIQPTRISEKDSEYQNNH